MNHLALPLAAVLGILALNSPCEANDPLSLLDVSNYIAPLTPEEIELSRNRVSVEDKAAMKALQSGTPETLAKAVAAMRLGLPMATEDQVQRDAAYLTRPELIAKYGADVIGNSMSYNEAGIADAYRRATEIATGVVDQYQAAIDASVRDEQRRRDNANSAVNGAAEPAPLGQALPDDGLFQGAERNPLGPIVVIVTSLGFLSIGLIAIKRNVAEREAIWAERIAGAKKPRT